MESGEQDGKLLLQLSCDTLVFTREFLQSCSKELESIEPEHVLCDNPYGVFKDFGNGFYAYCKHSKNEQTLVLKCTVGGVVFRVHCPIGEDKVMRIPEPLVLPHIDSTDLTLRRQAPCFSGYTMLSDDTVMIPLENLCRRVSESLSGNEKVVFNGVDRIEADYCFNITSRYLFVYPKQLLSAPKSELCHLTLAFNHSSSEASVKFAICLDLSRFSTLSTARLSLPFDTTSFEQKMLTQLTPSLSSPIAFVESVFCLDCHQFLTPRSDGSFIDRQSRATTAKSRSFIYSICDGVDHVATGIAVANLPSQSLEASNRRQTNAEY